MNKKVLFVFADCVRCLKWLAPALFLLGASASFQALAQSQENAAETATSQPSAANSETSEEGAKKPEEKAGPVDQKKALERVRANFEGNVINISEVRQRDRVRYRFRLDNEGNIYTVYVDQATGAVSRE